MSRRIREVSVDLWLGLALGAGTLALLMATLDEPTITWDEGYTITREDKVRSWFHLLISPEHPLFPGRLFGEPILQLCWPFARQEPDGHPPFYAVLGVAGWLISHAWLPPLEAYRFGPVLLFSFTMGVMYVFVARRWGRLAGVTAAGSWLLMPRIFAHAHFASYDMPLACLWFLSVAAFWKACERWPISFRSGITWSVTFAVVLAMAAATKFTGWLIPLPLLAWSGVQGIARLRREGIASLKWLLLPGVCVVPLLFVAPEVIRLLHKLAHTEAAVLETMPNADPIKWPTMVANEFRAQASGSVPFALAFLPAALWCVAAAWFGFRPSAAARRPGSPLAATWSAAAVLTPPLTVALIPTWWPDPLRGLAIFLWANLTRQKTIAIPTLFFGKTYEFSLPWYNTLAWVFLTVPAITFLIILFGLVATMASLGRVGNGAV
ncbi:MAG: hypothetical protein HY000_18640, partial [Planctomycetes bacterium]|nr:hypothetical protein [Planctomycetota bacterium]